MDGSVDGKKGHALFRLRRGVLKEEGLYLIRPRPIRTHRRAPWGGSGARVGCAAGGGTTQAGLPIVRRL